MVESDDSAPQDIGVGAGSRGGWLRGMGHTAAGAGGARMRGGAGLLVAVFALGALLPAGVAADERRDAEQRLDRVESEIAEGLDRLQDLERRNEQVSAELSEIEARVAELEDELAELEEELDDAEARLATAETAVQEAQEELAEIEVVIEVTREELEGLREVFGARIRTIYQHGALDVTNVLFHATNGNEFARQSRLAAAIMGNDVEQMTEIGLLEAQLQQDLSRVAALERRRQRERGNAERETDRIAELVAEADAVREDVEAEADEQRSLLASVEAEQEEYTALVAQREAESERIARQLRDLPEPGDPGGGSGPGPSDPPGGGNGQVTPAPPPGESQPAPPAPPPAPTGRLMRPVNGPVTSPFGWRTHPILGTPRLHSGIDYGAPSGTPIWAAESGRVVSSGALGGYGLTIIIDHGGGRATLYAHQSSLAVGAGQSVARGQVIGYVGSTGVSTGPHLHFEVRINGTPVNPVGHL